MTKKHFIRAAEIVSAIRQGCWTNLPAFGLNYNNDGESISPRDRAIQTAEAFVMLACEFNPRFDTQRFLVACGLVDAPVKVKAKRKPVAMLDRPFR